MLRKDIKKPLSASLSASEVSKFNAMATEWRNPNGAYKVIHAFNASRLNWLFEQLESLLGRRTFEDLTILDVGCATGIVSEAFARQGAIVLGIDVAERNLVIARACAKEAGLTIAYDLATPEDIAAHAPESFDTVLALEVVEHVHDVQAFLDALFGCVRRNGTVVVATLNRTWLSWFIGILVAERALGWLPQGTHNWRNFVKPTELDAAARRHGFKRISQSGFTFNPLTWRWMTVKNIAVNYMIIYQSF